MENIPTADQSNSGPAAAQASRSVISACDEHQERLTELEWREGFAYAYCPHCGKYKWPALHGEAAYDRALIRVSP